MPTAKSLSGKRLLIAEDEVLVAMELRQTMEEMGAVIIGITGSLSEALDIAGSPLDGALVDVQLGAEKSFALVEQLLASGVPVILTTGYDASVLPEPLHSCPRVTKPMLPAQLEKLAAKVFQADRA